MFMRVILRAGDCRSSREVFQAPVGRYSYIYTLYVYVPCNAESLTSAWSDLDALTIWRRET